MGGPAPVVATARRAVREALADLGTGSVVLVACSGGADSTALAAATAFVAPRLGLVAGAVVVDHGLQAGSDGVARDAAARCVGLGLGPVEVRRVVVQQGGAGPEGEARVARHAALEAVAREQGAAALLLGHTLDDQAETVLLGLARGSGGRALAGMATRRQEPWGVLCRPFLGLRRADTEGVCRALGLTWWDDPTNTPADLPGPAEQVPVRSSVRARVVPALVDVLGPGAVPALARTADLLRDDADLLDELAAGLLARALGPDDAPAPVPDPRPGRVLGVAADVVLDIETLAAAHPALRRRALRAAALRAGCPGGDLFAVHVDALDALVVAWHGQGAVHLPGDRRGVRSCGRLSLGSPQGPTPPPTRQQE